MKGIVADRYGGPEVLGMRQLEKPTIEPAEVLVRVEAAGLHVGDTFAVRGSPFPVRLMSGLRRPRYGVPGLDLAGRVEALGDTVTGFAVGDEVFGSGAGTCAEFAKASAGQLALKPAGLTFAEAAAVPTSGLAALHGLRDAGKLQPGQRVLINGASGGLGTFAVQIAKALGGEVTAVCSTANVELVRSLGADHVIDYTREDFTQSERRYDLILDNIENHSLSAMRRLLTPGGTLVLNSGTGASGFRLLLRLVHPVVLSPLVKHNLRRYLSTPNRPDLELLGKLVEEGRLRPAIGAQYSLEDTPQALRHLETGHA
ncbi:MAG TPA: NAD(P)-dependent alcohol dehydrogenase, partial [Candidatus Limnocylindria bacterium]|nr:NAD(P)-dependent alcohol dehydrogenase [Candidatus Limnocylindria bacterium]